MFGRRDDGQATQEGAPSPCPQEAWLELADGGRIDCAVFEDPDRDGGLRQFWLEPVRELAPGETATGWQIDALPGQSVVRVLWPLRGHHLMAQPTHLTWQDAQGRRYTTDSGLAIIGDVDGGFQDPAWHT